MRAPSSPDRHADREARLAAQTEFVRPVVLEAGAGTGKTTTLVARILAWCLGSGWERGHARLAEGRRREASTAAVGEGEVAERTLRGVVAITFTDAAAAEMAARLADELAALARGEPLPAWLEPPTAGDRIGRRAAALQAALDQLTVRTIHAYCRGLLAAHPLEAGLHPELSVDADGRILEEVVRETLESRLGELYGANADSDVVALASRGVGAPQIAEALVTLASRGVRAADLDADPFERTGVTALAGRLDAAARYLRDLVAPRLDGQTRVRSARAVVDGLSAFLARPREDDLEPLRRAIEDSGLGAARRLRDWRRGPQSAIEDELLGEVAADLAVAAGRLTRLVDHTLDLDPGLFTAARRTLAPLLSTVEEELRSRGVLTFQGLLAEAASLLAGNPPVRARLRRSLDQLLVDEFQDTDRLQCEIVRWLAFDGPAEERPGLFLVGDPKQSIYGWRSADLAAYDGFVDRVLAEGGQRFRLLTNFRSVPAVLEEVTRVVGPQMQHREGVQPAFEPLLPEPQRESSRGFEAAGRAPIEHWVAWRPAGDDRRGGPATRSTDADELEAAAIAADIEEIHHRTGTPWRSFALLFRSTGSLEIYLDALRHSGVPFAVSRDKQYFRRREVIEAAALVRAVLDPGDHLGLLAWLRSAAVGVPDAALLPLWSRGFPDLVTELDRPGTEIADRLRAAIAGAAAEVPAEVPGISRIAGWEVSLAAALEDLAVLRASFAADPGDVFVERLRAATLVEATAAARYLGAFRLANLERFFRQLEGALEDGGGDASSLLRLLRTSVAQALEAPEGRPQEAAEDAVQVMTIHKAKGLEFAHVYLPQLHHSSRAEAGRNGPRDDYGDGPDGVELRLFGSASPGFDEVLEERQAMAAAERVRLLYVAMTRARERLVLIGRWPAEIPAPVAPQQARTLLDLVAARPEVPAPGLAALWQEAAAGNVAELVDRTGARWLFPAFALPPGGDGTAALPSGEIPFPLAAVRAAATRLAQLDAAARERSARPFSAPASAEAHERLDIALTGERQAALTGGRDGGPRGVALAVGTAVHGLLEVFDPAADPGTEAGRLRDLARAAGAGLEKRREVVARTLELLGRIEGSGLLERLRHLGPHLLAREMPVVLPAGDDPAGPVGFVLGSVDLLYRDPDDGGIVVADFKTDVVTGTALEERVRAYALQGAVYTQAVQEALDLPGRPRFELWFLNAGEVLSVPLSGEEPTGPLPAER